MSISAVGFLFENKSAKKNSYTCTIHKFSPDGTVARNIVRSPQKDLSNLSVISPVEAKVDIVAALNKISNSNSADKFIGATIKDGIKETEVHSILSDKLYAVRTKDEQGKDKLRVLNKKNTYSVLTNNLNVIA